MYNTDETQTKQANVFIRKQIQRRCLDLTKREKNYDFSGVLNKRNESLLMQNMIE